MSTINVNFSDLAEFYPDGTHVTRGVYIHSTGSAVSAVGSVPTVSVLTEETNTPSDWRFKYDSGITSPFTRYYVFHVYIKAPGVYKFFVEADDGAGMTVYNGTSSSSVETGNWAHQLRKSDIGEISFSAKGYYKCEVRYYNMWPSAAALKFQILPASELVNDGYYDAEYTSGCSFSTNPTPDMYLLEHPYLQLDGPNVIYQGEVRKVTLLNPTPGVSYSLEARIHIPGYEGQVTISSVPQTGHDPKWEVGIVNDPECSNPLPPLGLPFDLVAVEVNTNNPDFLSGIETTSDGPSVSCIGKGNTAKTEKSECECGCNYAASMEDGCVSFSQNFGRSPWLTGATGGKMFILEEQPYERLFTAEALRYRHITLRKIMNTNLSSLALCDRILITDGCGTVFEYQNGQIVGHHSSENEQLQFEEGVIVEQLADRTKIYYDMTTGAVSKIRTPNGIEATASMYGVELITSATVTSGTTRSVIRQIYSLADGLMNVTGRITSGTSQTLVEWYAPSAVTSKTGGLYQVSAGAPVAKTFLFGQVPGTSANRNFELTEHRDPNFNYYYRWDYLPTSGGSTNLDGTWIYTRERDSSTIVTSKTVSAVCEVDSNGGLTNTSYLATTVTRGGWMAITHTETIEAGNLGNVPANSAINGHSYTSQTRFSSGNGTGKIAAECDQYGNTTSYGYDEYGRLTSETQVGFGGLMETTEFAYPEPDGHMFADRRPSLVTSKIGTQIFSVTSNIYADNVQSGRSETTFEIVSGMTQATIRTWYPVSSATFNSNGIRTNMLRTSEGRLKTIQHPDGRMTSYTYSGPSITSGAPSAGAIFTESATAGYANASGNFTLMNGKSTRTVHSRNVCGDIVKTVHYARVSNSFVSLGSDTFSYNVQHRQTSASYANGKTTSANWICTGPTMEVDVDGTTTSYTYDALKRCIGKTRFSPNGSISESYDLDIEGRTIRTVISGGSLTLSLNAAYDAENRIEYYRDATGLTTNWSYSEDRLTTTEVRPDGRKTTTMDSAGNLLSISGTAVIPEFYSYSFDSLGKCKVTTTHYATSNSARWVKVYTDGFGHTVKTIVPAFGGTSSITSNIFNSKGQLVSTTVTGRPSASFAYDSMGNRISQVISGGTVTRHQIEQTNFVSSAGAVWQEAVQSTFGSDTVSGTSTTPLVVSQTTKISMLSNAEESKKIQVDVHGNSAVTIQSFDTATKTHTTSQILPGITNIASTVTRDGLQLYSVNLNGGTMSLGYDALHRQITQTDPRGNVTSQVYNSYNQVVSVIDATGAVTSNDYDNAGRVSRITNALGGTVSFTYNPRNQKLSESGNATYPVSYGYNQFGEMTSLATYRVAGTPDITSFTVDPATGLLASKTYANGSSTVFSYDVAGKLTTKTLARANSAGNNISISMQYDAFNQLVSKSYENDEVIFSGTTYTTPPVAFTYDLMGRLTKVVDAGGTQTRIYNQYSELTTETYAVLGATVTYLHDSLGRHAGIIGTSGGSTFYETSQTYDAATGQINSATFASSATFAFSYVPGTNLESSIVTPTYVKTMTYETNRNLPTEIKYNSNGVGTELIAKRNYTFDALGRVSSRTWQNSTINRNDTFCYNPRSELTNAMLGDQTYTYAFDTIGNRSSTTITGDDDPTIYSTNNLNQYTGIAHDLESFQPSFDADGNQTSYQANTSSTKISGAVDYNAENQICLIRNNTENGRFTCFYDAFGRRISKNDWFWGSDTLITRYLYAGTQLLAEFKANPVTPNEFSLGQTYFWDPTQPIATRVLALRKDRSNYPLSYLTYDLTKNVCERISATGAVEDEFWYDPFGNLISYHNDLSIRFLFSSEYFDRETGLYSYLFRYYNSRIGNWMTRDPIGEGSKQNLYGMCGNNVLNDWDTGGLIDLEDVCAAINFIIYTVKAINTIRHEVIDIYNNSIIIANEIVSDVDDIINFRDDKPSFLNQINPFGLRDNTPKNYTSWFLERFPKTFENTKPFFYDGITKEICKHKNSPNIKKIDLLGADVIRYGYNANKPQYDAKQNWYERQVRIGSFSLVVDEIFVAFQDDHSYIFHAPIKIMEHTGATNPPIDVDELNRRIIIGVVLSLAELEPHIAPIVGVIHDLFFIDSAVRYWDLHMNYKEEGRSKVEAFASMTKMFYARDIEMGRVYIRGNGCCN